jgi:surfeit locus 1 family protein
MRFRATLWATLAVVPMLALPIGLGVWQLQRLEWKQGLIALRAERVISPTLDLVPRTPVELRIDPRPFDAPLPAETGLATLEAEAESFEYRPIRIAGTWRHDAAMHLVGRTRDGRAGEHVVTPLALRQGGVVLVDRGWVPPRRSSAAARDYARPAGRVVVEGYLRLFPASGLFTPDNEPQTDTWFWLDPDAMARASGTGTVTRFYVQAAPDERNPLPPFGSIPEIALRNPHLQYALTWFGVAAALAGVYVAFHIRRRDDGQATRIGGDG